MAKQSTPFTLEDLEKKGFYKNSQGDYEKGVNVVKSTIANKPKVTIEIKDELKQTFEICLTAPIQSVLTIKGIVAGLNGANGLMRAHWSKRGKLKKVYCQMVRDQLAENKIRKHEGKVKITYIGYKSLLFDWDNFCASFKLVGDSLVKENIIKDDSAKFIVEFLPKQIKCKRSEQKVVIIIQDV